MWLCLHLLSFWALGWQQAGISPFLMRWEEQLLPHRIRVKAGGGHWEGRGGHPAANLGASNPHNALQCWRTLNLCWMNFYVCSRTCYYFSAEWVSACSTNTHSCHCRLIGPCCRMAVYCVFIETRLPAQAVCNAVSLCITQSWSRCAWESLNTACHPASPQHNAMRPFQHVWSIQHNAHWRLLFS